MHHTCKKRAPTVIPKDFLSEQVGKNQRDNCLTQAYLKHCRENVCVFVCIMYMYVHKADVHCLYCAKTL